MPSLVRQKSGIYFIVSTVNGKRVWRSTRTRNQLEAAQTLVRFSQSIPDATGRPLSKCIEEYLAYVRASSSPRTGSLYQGTLQQFLTFTGDVAVTLVTARTIDQFKVFQVGKVGPHTVNIYLRVLRSFFNCLVRWEIVAKSPCVGVTQVRIPETLPAYLSLEDLEAFLAGVKDPWLRRIALFAAMTGVRLGEILSLTWQEVDLEHRLVRIQSNLSYRVKCGKMRTIPLNQTVLDLLERLPHRQGLVFPGKRGGHAQGNHVSRTFRKAARAAGLDPRLHFHSLRHTFASLLVQRGASIYQVQKLLGHTTIRTTQIYSHLAPESMHGTVGMIEIGSDIR